VADFFVIGSDVEGFSVSMANDSRRRLGFFLNKKEN
jgi:hypothetical protein